jgi:hypothetical protein
MAEEMTEEEEEWVGARNAFELVDQIRRLAGGKTASRRRKERLLACAALRLYWLHWWVTPPDVRELSVADIAERYADGLLPESTLRFAQRLGVADPAVRVIHSDSWYAARDAIGCATVNPGGKPDDPRGLGLLRDIFGNPFRPVTFEPTWQTSTAVAIARQMYESRDFSAMPILADALQDAGCEDTEVLDHCRDPNRIHARGCWVVDHVLAFG